MNLKKIYFLKANRFIYVVSLAAGLAIVLVGYLTVSLSYYFHSFVGFAIAVSLAAPALIIHREARRKKLMDIAFPALLSNLAQSQDTGMTLFQALEEASRRQYGPLSAELKRLTAQLSMGIEFEEAFATFSKRIGTDVSARISALILEAVKLGGDLKTTFESTSQFAKELLDLGNERESQLRPNLLIIYITNFVFVAVIVILYQSFLMPMAQPQGESTFLRLTMSAESYKGLLIDLAIVESLFGGLAAGKLSEGVTLNGLKHSVILTVVVTLAFTLLF